VAFLYPVQDALFFQPDTSKSSGMGTSGFTGQNPELGPHIAYMLNDVPSDAKVTLAIVDGAGTVVRELPGVRKDVGLHRQSWDMRVGPPLTGPVDTLAVQGRGGRGGFGGAGGGGG